VRCRAFCLGLATLLLASCTYDRSPNLAVEAPRFGVPPEYRQKIVAWTKRYYVEPNSVRFVGVTDPVPALTTGGVPIWLVCVELSARERGGPYMGPSRIVFGLNPELFSAPAERRNIDLQNEDCDRPQLVWREWRQNAREKRAIQRRRMA
jgi:hypothetical protein